MIAMQGKGNALKAMGRTSESDAAFAKAKELGYNTSPVAQEKTSDYWIKIGDDLALNKSNNQEELAAYQKAIQIDPENAIAWINKAYALSRLNKTAESNLAYHKALEMTNKTLETDPMNVTLWLEKGLLLNNVGNVKEAVKAFGNATSIDPKNEMAWKMEGVILANDLHKYNEAVKAFDRHYR
jgi:tetratricopeptide (TPR) repeat protein